MQKFKYFFTETPTLKCIIYMRTISIGIKAAISILLVLMAQLGLIFSRTNRNESIIKRTIMFKNLHKPYQDVRFNRLIC